MTNSPSSTCAGKIAKTDAVWRAQPTGDEYEVPRQHGEWAGSSALASALKGKKRRGTLACVICGEALFPSDANLPSDPGRPNFEKPAAAAAATARDAARLFMHRRVRCARCEAHLGQVFPAGGRASSTGLQSLQFKPGGT
jgi:peptide-methionine (R)-S-oxide reductase